MLQPTFKIFKQLVALSTEGKDEQLDDSFDSDFENITKETLVLPARTKMLTSLSKEGLEKWELKVLDLLKFDCSTLDIQ